MTSPQGFDLTTATPLQRAVFRASAGEPLGELWDLEVVRNGFGGVCPEAGVIPRVMALTAAIRSAKSKWAAGRVFYASQFVDLSKTSASDEIRIPIVSTEKDTAGAVFSHLVETLQEKPALRARMIGAPTAMSVWLRHTSGRPIEVKVTALSRYASTLVGRWLASVVFDEAPRMVGESEGVKNLTEAVRAVRARVLDGGQILMPGSPWAPYGPVYDLVQECFGKPTADCVVVRGRGPDMNPEYWNAERVAYTLRSDPRAYRTDCLGEFADSEDAMFASIEVEAAMRKALEQLPPKPGCYYSAAMDPATRGNAWTLMVLGCVGTDEAGRPLYSVALARQWKGSKSAPLKAGAVLREMKALLEPYGVDTIITDQHQVDTLSEMADEIGLTLIEHAFNRENRYEMAERCRILISEKRLELPPDPQVRRDLVATVRKTTQNGVTLELPNTGDGRHCDYVPTLSLAVEHAPPTPDEESEGEFAADERAIEAFRKRAEKDPRLQAALKRVADRNNQNAFSNACKGLQ